MPVAEAFRRKVNRRDALTRFVADERLDADNNVAENAGRGIALGVGSGSGGERAAAI